MKNWLAIALLIFCGDVSAAPLNVGGWTQTVSPSTSYIIQGKRWTYGDGFAYKPRIGNGTLVSPFSIDGDFVLSGAMATTPYYRNTGLINRDNDPIGVVFGWTDISNHYRFGMSGVGNGYADRGSSSERGLWLIREENGIDNVLFHDSVFRYSVTSTYHFTVGRSGSELFFDFLLNGSSLFTHRVEDTVFMSGAVGLYSESTPPTFTELSLDYPPALARLSAVAAVPLPATAPMALIGFLMAVILSRRGRSRRAGAA
jgi:hypothetical protein